MLNGKMNYEADRMLTEICQHLPGVTQDDDLSGYPICGLGF